MAQLLLDLNKQKSVILIEHPLGRTYTNLSPSGNLLSSLPEESTRHCSVTNPSKIWLASAMGIIWFRIQEIKKNISKKFKNLNSQKLNLKFFLLFRLVLYRIYFYYS